MKRFFPTLVLAVLCASPAFAWHCPAGQHWVQTPGQTNVEVGSCVSDNPPADPKTSQSQIQTQTSSSNSSSISNSKANSSSTSSATGGSSISTATGGSATATGGSSDVKNSGNSTLTNSGNSSNANTSAASNNSSGNITTFSSIQNVPRNTPMAYAPDAAFTTSPCIKGFSGGFSLPGVGGTAGFSKTDKGCDSRQTAVIFHALGNDSAAAKLLCSTDASKRAKLTLDECLAIVAPIPQVIIRENPAPTTPAPQVIVVPISQFQSTPPVSPVISPVFVGRKKTTPRVARVCKTNVKITDVGSCRLINDNPTSLCYPILDKAIISLTTNPGAKIVLTGPVESGKVIPYLKKRVNSSRIEIRLADEQNSILSIQTETGE